MRSIAGFFLCAALIVCACGRRERPFAFERQDLRSLPPPRQALRDSAFRVRWDAHTVPREVPANTSLDIRLSLTNVSDQIWPDVLAGDPAKRDGAYAVRLGHYWIRSGEPLRRSATRTDLPRPIQPGETISLLVNVEAPSEPGEYQLVFELLQELVAWFDAKGATKLVIPVAVK